MLTVYYCRLKFTGVDMEKTMKSFRSKTSLNSLEIRNLIEDFPKLIKYFKVQPEFWEAADLLGLRGIIEKWEAVE